MIKDLERLLTYCPTTDKKADDMLNQGNKLVGYIFKDGETYRTCAFGSVRNSISQKEWEGLTFPNQPSYEQLEKELAELKEKLARRYEMHDFQNKEILKDKEENFKLREELAELKEANRWRSVGDELPEDFTEVLIWPYPPFTNTHTRTAERSNGYWFITTTEGVQKYDYWPVTHWRPLPELPAVEGGE